MYSHRNSRSEGLPSKAISFRPRLDLIATRDRFSLVQASRARARIDISSSAFRCPARPHLSKLLSKGLKLEIGNPSRLCSCVAIRSSLPALILFRPSDFVVSSLVHSAYSLYLPLSRFSPRPAVNQLDKELSQVLRTWTYART